MRRRGLAVGVLVAGLAAAGPATNALRSGGRADSGFPAAPVKRLGLAAFLPKPKPVRRVRPRAPTPLERLIARRLPLYCGGGREPYVALTFDDGPGAYTGALLGKLRRAHARATFFVVGDRLRDWPQLAPAEEQLGGVGDHTWDHARLLRLPRRAARWEVAATRRAIIGYTGRPVRFFRPPYGKLPPRLARVVRREGMLEVLWSVDSRDFAPGTTPAAILRRVAPQLRPGAIVLLHDIHPWTVRAVPRLLALVRRRGLAPVGLEELVTFDPPTLAQMRADAREHGCSARSYTSIRVHPPTPRLRPRLDI